ncbi:hypothetical protein AAJ76_207000566 [Vairimorpha ceranae]|uniref:Uncharacterized protein n=1 Tax=Vairimorpha ceranae TaxID=40302 RepID=A0A0F9WA92_9MICR|nr:hypothetical protein AAJ76_207000566 [Vairimorpha ceranae]KKO73840.1 hypothetical protein AAJ76_207000566 [Vairimorpha ceranae]
MRRNFFQKTILPIIGTDINCSINFLKSKGLTKRSMCFVYYSRDIYRLACSKIKDKFVWKCGNKQCLKFRTTLSIRNNSFFEKTRIDLQMRVYSIYLWSINTSHKNIGVLARLGHNMVADMCRSFRNACVEFFTRNPIFLSGPGIICQIDERSFFHKQKYHGGTNARTSSLGFCDG